MNFDRPNAEFTFQTWNKTYRTQFFWELESYWTTLNISFQKDHPSLNFEQYNCDFSMTKKIVTKVKSI